MVTADEQPAGCSRSVRFRPNAIVSFQETSPTGSCPPLAYDRVLPLTVCHCAGLPSEKFGKGLCFSEHTSTPARSLARRRKPPKPDWIS